MPRCYLRAWADGQQIAMRRVGASASIPIGVRDAGVRTNFYRRTGPDGEAIYDVEWSLGQAESAALPLVRALADRWPLPLNDKACIGRFFALQLVRGPAFAAWHQRFVAARAEEMRRGIMAVPDVPGRARELAISELHDHLGSDTQRHVRMLSLVRSVGTVLASMHWTVVDFVKPVLATGDHPVVVWPLSRPRSRPCANDLDAGVTNALEIFSPVSPTRLLLMSWRDDPDEAGQVRGAGRHAGTANAFVVANAEAQWFHRPGGRPWLAAGFRDPLSTELVARYTAATATASARREQATQLARQVAATPLANRDVPMVEVRARAA